MIDFRYHLVSLISVFLALAVGIILGAGPLQNAIGDQLTDQVEALRVERTALRDSLSEAEAARDEQSAYALAAGAELVDGSLEDVRVAVVDVDGVSGTREAEVVAQLEAAGARVVAQSSMTGAWTSAGDAVLRGTVADGQRGRLDGVVEGDATTAQVLGSVLGVALTEADAEGSESRSTRAVELYQLLSQVGLIESRFAPSAPAEAVLLLSAGTEAEDVAATESSEVPEDVDAVGAVLALQAAAGTVVVAGPTAVDGDLVADLRSDETATGVLSTVSGIEQELMRLNVPLALAAQYVGEVGQYGFEDDAAVVPPAVDLADRAGSGTDAGTDGEGS
ncbi:copper transport outer membrane protein MctB [Isoptericola jiangsuensis]|uniref:Copper transport outer membrane protein MctB n=1 Tax=Isoptericola jiangsuensis TaxID=548579 RepID=A0A2A9EWG9_9MICO|nr:copper transporter [Isoptericola jiangsuensis]PFG42926.1 copper transport outer membrane protein MctB [Isoptericola jiangsuensis]